MNQASRTEINPPKAKKIDHQLKIHSKILQDPYFWMRDRDNPDVREYLEAENAYAESMMKSTVEFQKTLYDEMVARIKEDDESVPVKVDDYFYYFETRKGEQYTIHYRKKGSLDAQPELLLDVNALAKGKDYLGLGAFAISPDHRYLAYSTDTTGGEIYTLYVRDLEKNELLTEEIGGLATGLEWGNDSKTLFYTKVDEAKRPYQLWKHVLGSELKDDKLIFEEKDDAFVLSIDKTKDKRYLVMSVDSSTTSEGYVADADDPVEFKMFSERKSQIEYSIEHHNNLFYVLTNENAQNFKIMVVSDDNYQRDNWQDFLEHRPAVKIEDFDFFEDFMVVHEREDGLSQIRIYQFSTDQTHYIDFPEPVYSAWGGANPEFKTSLLRFGYTSLVTPRSVFDYDMADKSRELKKQQEVLGGYDKSLYETKRLFATSHDGVRVPISMVYRKDKIQGKDDPLFLYGYGSYGITIDPEFSSNRLSLLDRGVVFTIAHIRGGGHLGRPWYDEGKLLKKKNTFEDFIACAEYLISENYTSSSKLVIEGGSAGGMLMGAVLNMRPDLFHAAVAKVPFVDVINTMLDKTLPLTVGEFEEWGNPEDEEYFDYIYSYAPYENVESKNYPHILVTSGLYDPRVQYWEPTKWVAKLRELKTDQNHLLLKTNMEAGHGGASGRYDYLKEIAFDFAFILDKLGKLQERA